MRNNKQVEQFIAFFELLMEPKKYRQLLIDFKNENDKHKEYVEEIRKIRDVDKWVKDMEMDVNKKFDAVSSREDNVLKAEKELKEKVVNFKDGIRVNKDKLAEYSDKLDVREVSVSKLEDEREHLQFELKRVSDKERVVDEKRTALERKEKAIIEAASQ